MTRPADPVGAAPGHAALASAGIGSDAPTVGDRLGIVAYTNVAPLH